MSEQAKQSEKNSYTDDFNEVLREEYLAILERRKALNEIVGHHDRNKKSDAGSVAGNDPPWLFGVALSGGGIRSASFCLGALQALDQYGLTPRMDYLSTVSGGGYIGAAMVADMTRQEVEQAKRGEDKQLDFPFASRDDAHDVRDNPLVGHIRDNSRFLAPRGFRDITLSIGILMRGWMVNFLLLLTLVLPLATFVILTNPTTDHLGHSIILDVADWVFGDDWGQTGWTASLRSIVANPFVLSHSALAVFAIWLVAWGLRRSYSDSYAVARKGEHLEQDSFWARDGRALLLITTLLFLIEVQPKIILWLIEVTSPTFGRRQTTLETLKALIAAAAAIVTATAAFRGLLISWVQKALNSPKIGHQIRGYLARAAFLALGLALPLLIYGFFLLITLWGIKISPVSIWGINVSSISIWGIDIPWIFGRASGYAYGPVWLTANSHLLFTTLVVCMALFLAGRTFAVRYLADDLAPGRLSSFFAAMMHDYSGSVVVKVVLVLASSVVFAMAARRSGSVWHWDEVTVLLNYLAITAIVTIVAFNFTENANGLHRLYRDRLRWAFRLGGSEGDADIALKDLGVKAPYLLINGTLNVRCARQAADPPRESFIAAVIRWVARKIAAAMRLRAWRGPEIVLPGRRSPAPAALSPTAVDPSKRGRNAEFFLFSKHFVGSESTGYARSKAMAKEEGQLDLAAAAAISGAAISSSMGRISLGLLGPTLALLNLRLGFWLPNPSGPAFDDRRARSAFPATEEDTSQRSWEDILRLYLLAEATGQLRSDSSRVYITDGGHIDNIGLYQLLKRRCKLIIVVDAEADAGMNFGAFTDVQRFARIDLGVRISLDWRPVRDAALARDVNRTKIIPADSLLHLRHFAVGRIMYEKDPVEGILLYVKASVTGDEPDYVLDYERRYPLFPNEPTSDQFFSEEQMEAYRALGFHAMDRALREKQLPADAEVYDFVQTDLVTALKTRLGKDVRDIDK
ncbi:patatin-like phospholipase family protein [Mesorhizobium sp. ES1-3]|uniref:patatin-like phospholipase family protein n=1 Tax=Mesorhizobium sp. ES1-3 TaxID=2876628 RepID=UPI001CCE9896|nr:patatin-like phospholipase family protein [Mesorhizobium sp. ES1-3]MBZ9672338.1 patatin-like phospholipase family protein [Mesorhizobium sp. ES1-3]